MEAGTNEGAPLREIVDEILVNGELHEVLECGHFQKGEYDEETGDSTSDARACLACLAEVGSVKPVN